MLSVVIADDNPIQIQCLKLMLESIDGIEVVGEAENGRKALELAESLQPDVIFLDVEMPEMTGVEVARELKSRQPEIYIIFVTGHPEYVLEAFEVGSIDYLLKPYNEERLYESIDRVKKVFEAKTRDQDDILEYLQGTDTFLLNRAKN